MKPLLVIFGVGLGLWLIHRLLLWAEGHGWIYYVRKKADPASLGTAFLSLHQIAEPQQRHVLEARQRQRAEHDDAAGPDDPGGGATVDR